MGAMPKRRNNNSNSLTDGRRIKMKHIKQQQQHMQQQQSQTLEDNLHETKANGISTSNNSNNQQQRYHHHHRLPHPSHNQSGDGGAGNNGMRSSRFSSSESHSHGLTNNNGKLHNPLSNLLNSRNSHNTSNNNNINHHNRRKALDPTLLARGMSSRSIGARVSSQIRPLSLEEMEKDVRHMEVFGTACIAYAQQFFIYTNRESVSRGVYGPVPSPSPGLLAHHPGQSAISPLEGGGDGATVDEVGSGSIKQNQLPGAATISSSASAQMNQSSGYSPHPTTSSSSNNSNSNSKTKTSSKNLIPGGGITMPVRIDPEEEKRLSILRKRVAASEAKREVLETEYLSLLAHYVHEIHLLRHARRNTDGQLGLLQELSRRRGEVLALRRVRVAVGRDILNCLKYRKENAGVGLGVDHGKKTDDMEEVGIVTSGDVSSLDHSADDKNTTTTTVKEDVTCNKVPEDLIDIWTAIEARLHEAELACSEVETPKELFQVKSALSTAVAAAKTSGSSGNKVSNGCGTSSSDANSNHTCKSSSSSSNVSIKNSKSASLLTKVLNSTSLPTQQQHQRRSQSPSRPKEGEQEQQQHQDTDQDGSGSGSGSGTSNNGTLAKKKGSKTDNSKQDSKGNGGNQSNATTSIEGGEIQNASHTGNNSGNGNNNNNKGSIKSYKKSTNNNHTNESSPCTEGGGVTESTSSRNNAVGDESSSTAIATITTTGSSFKNTHTKSKRRQSISSSNQNMNGDDQDDNVIPWSCQIMPRTPYDVSVFISNLSSVPDGSAAFGCGNIFGNDDSSMIWLESNLPKPSSALTSSKMLFESQKLVRLRREVQKLSEKLDADVIKNRDLQKDLISNRKRSDQLSAMVCMLRTETEAVLNRHNNILDTPEARELAAELLEAKSARKAEAGDGIEEEDSELNSEEDDDEMEEEDDDEEEKDNKSSDGGTVIEDEDGDGGGLHPYPATAAELEDMHTDPGDSVEEGEIHEEEQVLRGSNADLESREGGDIDGENGDDEEEDETGFEDGIESVDRHQPMREVIVPRLNSVGDEGEVEEESAVVDEEDGEINEDYSTATGFEVGKRGFSEVSDGGSGEIDSTTLPFLENDQDKKRRRV